MKTITVSIEFDIQVNDNLADDLIEANAVGVVHDMIEDGSWKGHLNWKEKGETMEIFIILFDFDGAECDVVEPYTDLDAAIHECKALVENYKSDNKLDDDYGEINEVYGKENEDPVYSLRFCGDVSGDWAEAIIHKQDVTAHV